MSEFTVYIYSILGLLFLSFNSYILFRVIKLLKPVPKPTPKRKPKAKKALASAKNNTAVNAVHEYQKIQTAEITIPVIAEDVLTYGPGELGAAYPDTTNLYYPESAISDEDYLDTITRSALQVQTHEKNTSEYNRDVDGWPLEAWYDSGTKKAMLKGILHGEANVAYAKENLNKPGFGTSAFISFIKIRKQEGIAPNGKKYNAIAEKLVNNHVAILPNIRDPKNVIVALNAVAKEEDDTTTDDKDKNEITNNEDKPMPVDKDELRKAMNEIREEDAAKEDAINKAVKNELEKKEKEALKEAENKAKNEDKEETKSEEKAENTADEDKDDAEAANALPSDEMLKDFSDHLGIKFPKAPTLRQLGKMVGVEAKNSFELITALNAKRKEITSGSSDDKDTPEGKNSKETVGTLDEFLNKL